MMRFVFIVHYFAPINSAGAKRVEALSKNLIALGHDVTIITTCKSSEDGPFTEVLPAGVNLIELDRMGRTRSSSQSGATYSPMYTGRSTWRRRTKDLVFRWFGQLPDPRLPFSLAFLNPWMSQKVKAALSRADIVIGSTPPWPMLLAALIVKWRFGVRCILDYRDHFSECHEMPGSKCAKYIEKQIDSLLVRASDYTVVISPPMATYYKRMTNDVEVIMNGFDENLMASARGLAASHNLNGILISHMGVISPGRVPHHVLSALTSLKNSNTKLFDKIHVHCYGSAALLEQVILEEYAEIRGAFRFFDQITYAESLIRMVSSDYLLFSETSSTATLSAQGILPTKLFEYLGAGRPIIADISPGTLAGSLIRKYGARSVIGDTVDFFVGQLSSEQFYKAYPSASLEICNDLTRKAGAIKYSELARRITSSVR